MVTTALKISLLAQLLFAAFLFLFAASIRATDAFFFLDGFALCAGIPVFGLLLLSMHLLRRKMDRKQAIVGLVAGLMMLHCLLSGALLSLFFGGAFSIVMPFAAGAGAAGAIAAFCCHQSLYENLCHHYSSFEQ